MQSNTLEFTLSQTANSYFLTSESVEDFKIGLKTDGGLNSFMEIFKNALLAYIAMKNAFESQNKFLKEISTEQINQSKEKTEYKITAQLVTIPQALCPPTLQ